MTIFDPIVSPDDRFPFGLPGHQVPVTDQPPTACRPWGMDRAIVSPATDAAGKHEKPTTAKPVKVPTEYTNDSETVPDDYTQTVTD